MRIKLKNAKKFLKTPTFLLIAGTIISTYYFRRQLTCLIACILLFIGLLFWNPYLIITLIGFMLNRRDLLKLYKEIYTVEEYRHRFEVTPKAVMQNCLTLLEAASFSGTIEEIPVIDIYKFTAPLLVPFHQSTTETGEWLFKLFKALNMQLIVRGTEKIPKGVPLVVMANHVGMNDVIVGYYVDQVRGLSNSIFLGMQYSPYLKTNENIFASVKWEGCLVPGTEDKLVERVKNGQALLIFPEGSFAGHKFFDGYLRIAVASNAWIQPVRIQMQYPRWIAFFRRISPTLAHALIKTFMWRIYRNNKLEITFGDPISPEVLSKEVENQIYIDKKGRVRYMDSILDKHYQIVKNLK